MSIYGVAQYDQWISTATYPHAIQDTERIHHQTNGIILNIDQNRYTQNHTRLTNTRSTEIKHPNTTYY